MCLEPEAELHIDTNISCASNLKISANRDVKLPRNLVLLASVAVHTLWASKTERKKEGNILEQKIVNV